MNDDAVRDIKRALIDPVRVCEQLGLLGSRGSFSRQAGGVLVRCPVHDDRTPSCSVQTRSGVLLWKCHACSADGDILTLIAARYALSMAGDDFRQVLIIGAELAGLHDLANTLGLRDRQSRPQLVTMPEPSPADETRDYPAQSELDGFWRGCGDLDESAVAWVAGRNLDPAVVAEIAKGLPRTRTLPKWASYQGKSWQETGHRIVVPVYDHGGWMRSVRAIRVIDGDAPKRLPPGGHKAAGLVMACDQTLSMLRGEHTPTRVLIVEGEPDFLSAATIRFVQVCAKIGITSGSWSADFAARIPKQAHVYIGTHNDPAGDKYAKAIADSLPKHTVRRWSLSEAA